MIFAITRPIKKAGFVTSPGEFIGRGRRMRKVRFVEPAKVYRMMKDELDAAYFDVMSRGDLIDRGHLRGFEENLARYVGTKYAVGLNSGYDALHMSLRAAGIGRGRGHRPGAYICGDLFRRRQCKRDTGSRRRWKRF